jgi:hypothetical protein
MFILRDLRHRPNMVLAELVSADGSTILHELWIDRKIANYYFLMKHKIHFLPKRDVWV